MAEKPSILEQLHPNPKLEKLRNEELRLKTKMDDAEVKVHQSEHKVALEENRIETKELTDNQFMEFCDALFSFPGIRAHIERILFDIKLKEMD